MDEPITKNHSPFARIVAATESIVLEEEACRSGSFTTSAQPARIAARTAMAASSAPGSAITPTNISTTTPPNPPGNACPPWRADIPIGAFGPSLCKPPSEAACPLLSQDCHSERSRPTLFLALCSRKGSACAARNLSSLLPLLRVLCTTSLL